MIDIKPSLKTVLKRLRLSGILATLPDRDAYAKKTKLSPQDFLELILQDEIDRREQNNLQVRLKRARFAEEQTFEGFDWDAPVTFDRERVRDLFSLGIYISGTSNTTTGYIRVTNNTTSGSQTYAFGTGNTITVAVTAGHNYSIRFGNTAPSGTVTATLSAVYYY